MRQTNAYVILFALAICLVCSLALSIVAGALRDQQEQNRVLDRQKNILKAVGYAPEDLAKRSGAEVEKLFADTFEEIYLDAQGNPLEGVSAKDLTSAEASGEEKRPTKLPLFRQKDARDATKTVSYVYPVAGKGLWSTMYGYLAVKPDGNEIIGVAFYKHGETPGLGGEIEKTWFTDNFKGQRLYQGEQLVGIEVVKGKKADQKLSAEEALHKVDGMSGATLTGNGVTKLMKAVPMRYRPFFQKLRTRQTAMMAPKLGGAL